MVQACNFKYILYEKKSIAKTLLHKEVIAEKYVSLRSPKVRTGDLSFQAGCSGILEAKAHTYLIKEMFYNQTCLMLDEFTQLNHED